MRIADILTAMRVIFAPIIVWFILSDEVVAALCLYAAATITDVLDGYSARRSEKAASYGPTFDALADFTLVYSTMLALVIRGEAFWLLVVGLISIAYLIPVLGFISRKVGNLTIPHLDTSLLAIAVHSTIMVYIIDWQYAEIVLGFAFLVALCYARKYVVFARSIQRTLADTRENQGHPTIPL
jgi:phosphatidylglycerophosphate synthase